MGRKLALATLSADSPAPVSPPADAQTQERLRAERRLIGHSRAGRPIHAWRLGTGRLRVSLLGGCHADEPVGPRFLRRFLHELAAPCGAALRAAATWTVLPHINPDGALANARWQSSGAEVYDFVDWLRNRRRELPGDDIEFGFPHGATDASRARDDAGAEAADRQTPGAHGSDSSPGPPPRPENVAAWRFWQRGAPYDLHLSMHGMGVAAGPYFLIERSWWPRFAGAAAALSREVAEAGYTLHDAERQGEKGFHRLAPGFCSRPDSRAMRRHFLKLGAPATAARFRPSSMEAVRVLSGRDTLTLVTEMPLFILPGVGREPGPPDPVFVRWRERIAAWEARLVAAEDRAEGAERVQAEVRAEAAAAGVRPMPVRDQMRFQRALLGAGLGAMGGDCRLL